MNTSATIPALRRRRRGFLADEVHALTGLTGQDLLVGRGGVLVPQLARCAASCTAAWPNAYWCNWASGPTAARDDIYALASGCGLGDLVHPRQSFKVEVTAQHSPLKSLNFRRCA